MDFSFGKRTSLHNVVSLCLVERQPCRVLSLTRGTRKVTRPNIYFLAPHINIARSVYYSINMPALGRGLESKIPSVSDGLPIELEKGLKGKVKPTLIERLDNMPRIKGGFRAMRIPERPTVSLLNKIATPIEYFNIFLILK